jgi:hypothetical protein
MLSWLMFIASGIGPYSGQAVHFRNMAPEPKEYALNRYDFEAHRHWQIIEDRLSHSTYMLGENYSIVDMAFWGWARLLPIVTGMNDMYKLDKQGFFKLLAGLGGLVMASRLKSGDAKYGGMYELYVIAAVVVGGTSLRGGYGSVFGTLIGALIIAVIENGMNLVHIESYTQKVVFGAIILLAVLLDRIKHAYGSPGQFDS